MTADTQTIPDEIASRTARLINEAEDMRQQASDDLKQIYADLREELKAIGWDGKHVSAEVAFLKGAIAEMRLDDKAKTKREERGERIDDYVSLLTRARAHTRGRKSSGEILGPKLAHTVVTGMQTETGRAALIAAVDIMIDREEAEEHPTSDDAPIVPPSPAAREAEDSTAINSKTDAAISRPGMPSMDRPEIANRSDKEGSDSDTSGGMQDEEAIHPATFSAPASQGEAEAPSAERVTPHRSGSAAANVGGDHVAAHQSTAATVGAAVSAAPAKSPLRPHCQNPGDGCGGYGTNHCHRCKVAMRERELA